MSGERHVTIATVYDRHGCGSEMRAVAAAYERRFDTRFHAYVFFDADLLAALHAPGPLPGAAVLASATDPQVVRCMETITAIANTAEQSRQDRAQYLLALDEILARLSESPVAAAVRSALVIAPQREGRILAERRGCLRTPVETWTPQAKRMPVDGGLLVGFDGPPARRTAGRVTAVDGVVASGVTLMAALQLATAPGAVVDLFTCHATAAGARALDRYAGRLGVDLTQRIGHVSGRLNDHLYAVDPDHADRLVLGDIGDTISPVVDGAAVSR
jgi:hypothetical protein